MSEGQKSTSETQPAENQHLRIGQRPVKRLKARHLSALTRKLIVDKFTAIESAQDVADQMDIPGLTRETVFDVLHSFALRKQPGTAQSISGRQMLPVLVRKAGVA